MVRTRDAEFVAAPGEEREEEGGGGKALLPRPPYIQSLPPPLPLSLCLGEGCGGRRKRRWN